MTATPHPAASTTSDSTGAGLTWPGLLTELVAGNDLDAERTAWAMDQVMSGEVSPVRLASFLVALRAKGETVAELTGLADAMLAHASRFSVDGPAVDIVGTGGDRAHTVNISTMASLVIAGAGVRVVKHGNRAATSSSGAADVLEELGIRLDHGPDRVARIVQEAGITFCFAMVFHPSMRHAGVARKELGIPTAFNVLGPLTNPAQPRAAAIGVADARMAPLIAGVLAGRGPRRRWLRAVVLAALVLATVAFVYPLLWLLSASFKPRAEVFDNRLVPRTFTLDNYVTVWQEAPLALWLGNTVVVTVLAAGLVTVSSALVAWGFAFFRFRGRGALFALVLATMMLPGAVTMIPTFLIWNQLGLVGTNVPLWAGNLFASAFYVFLLRQFFLGLPREPFEAARLDGANNWQMFWRIAVPLCRPVLVLTLLFEAQAAWTDLMRPLIYLQDSSTFTIPRGLKALIDQFGPGGESQWEVVVTASVITTLPMILLFFLGQRHFVEGVATTGSKG